MADIADLVSPPVGSDEPPAPPAPPPRKSRDGCFKKGCLFVLVMVLLLHLLNTVVGDATMKADAFVRNSVVPVIRSYDPDMLLRISSDSLTREISITSGSLENMFGLFSERLGPVQNIRLSRSKAMWYFNYDNSPVVTLQYSAEFQKAPGMLFLQVAKNRRSKSWELLTININSRALLAERKTTGTLSRK